jgi:hypothetical protein
MKCVNVLLLVGAAVLTQVRGNMWLNLPSREEVAAANAAKAAFKADIITARELVGVTEKANCAMIRKACRELAKPVHPDRDGSNDEVSNTP